MDSDDIVLGGVILFIVLVLGLVVYKAATEPTCEELGGKSEFSHMLPVWSGKSVVYVPQYNCIMPTEEKDVGGPPVPTE